MTAVGLCVDFIVFAQYDAPRCTKQNVRITDVPTRTVHGTPVQFEQAWYLLCFSRSGDCGDKVAATAASHASSASSSRAPAPLGLPGCPSECCAAANGGVEKREGEGESPPPAAGLSPVAAAAGIASAATGTASPAAGDESEEADFFDVIWDDDEASMAMTIADLLAA